MSWRGPPKVGSHGPPDKQKSSAAAPVTSATLATPAANSTNKFNMAPDDPEYPYLVVDRKTFDELDKTYDAKKSVWIPDATEAFIPASIKESKGDIVIVALRDGTTREVNKNEVSEMNPPKFELIDDMSDLTFLNEACILHNLRARFRSLMIYTYSGLFCVFVNPYRWLPIYSEAVTKKYHGKRRGDMPPHIFAVSGNAYADMLQDRENQSILITGESGAGKTENTKKVIQYFAKVAATGHFGVDDAEAKKDTKVATLEDQIVQCNPLLEAYGNAKTIRNNNSSRFGKFIRIHFGPTGRISGADIEIYLLERSRVTKQRKQERGFHVFYQILTNQTGLCEGLLLQPKAASYSFINQGLTDVEGIDDKVGMKITDEAMHVLGFTPEERKSLFSATAAILWLGEMKIKQQGRDDQAEPDGTAEAEKVAFLLGLPAADLLRCLTKPKVKVGNEMVTKAQNREQVLFAVNALAKSLYSRMFDWLIKRCNSKLETTLRRRYFIGVLDIAGFEIFEFNTFEQLGINYTNERLQQFFNHHMFVLEQEQYRVEGIQWEFIDFGLDLQSCIDLIEKPLGIMAILEEECMFPKATDRTFIDKLHQIHLGKSPNFTRPKAIKHGIEIHFEVIHYAGTVAYNCIGWLDRNKDPLNESVIEAMTASVDPLVSSLFQLTEAELQATQKKRKVGSFITVSGTHRESLNKLMKTLYLTHPHFVRCIIPNESRSPGELDPKLVLNQLRCNGVLEGIRICRKGYPNRVLYPDFKQRYAFLVPGCVPKIGFVDARMVTQKILESLKFDADSYKMGQTKVFFRSGVLGKLEEMREQLLGSVMSGFQAQIRGYLLRAKYKKLWDQRNALEKIQRNIRKYLAVKDWKWWKLYMLMKPLLTKTRDEDEVRRREEELKKLREEHDRLEKFAKQLEQENAHLLKQKNEYYLQLQAELDTIADVQEKLASVIAQRNDYEAQMKEYEQRNSEMEAKLTEAETERTRLEARITALQADNATLDEKLKSAETDLATKETELRTLREELGQQEHQLIKTVKEKKQLEDEKKKLLDDLAAEEEKTKQLTKTKQKLEGALDELEGSFEREKKLRADTEKQKRKLEADLKHLEDVWRESEAARKELEENLRRKDADILTLNGKIEEDTNLIAQLQKRIKELLARIAELEDELERERQARIRAERARSDTQRDLEEMLVKLEESVVVNQTQAETIRKRDAEIAKMRKDLEDQRVSFEQALSAAKKKQSDAANELSDQLDQATKAKLRFESDNHQLRQELEEIQAQLDLLLKAKSSSDKSLKTMENQLLDLQAQLDDRNNAVSELTVDRNRYMAERETLQHQFEELDAQMAAMVKLKQQAHNQADEYRRLADEEARAKGKAINELRTAQADLDKLREQLDEEAESKSLLQRQLTKTQTELQSLKQRIANGEFGGQSDMSEEAKRRMLTKISTQEQEIEELKNKLLQMEKSKQRLQQDLDDAFTEVQRVTSICQQSEKKQRLVDKTINEYTIRIQDITIQLEAAQKESRTFSAELFKLRAELEDTRAAYETVKRENKALSSELQELMLQLSHGGRSVHEIEKVRRRLEAETTELKTHLAETESALEIEENKVIRITTELTQMKQDYDRRLSEKDEEFEGLKKSHLKALEALQLALEAEIKSKSELLHQKNKISSDIVELEAALDVANKARVESEKTLKRFQIQITELQIQLDNAASGRDPLMEQLAAAERRIVSLSSELEDVRMAVDSAERARKNAETELLENNHRLAEMQELNHQLMNAKRKADMDVTTLTSEIETVSLEMNSVEEKYKRIVSELSKVTDELKVEQDNTQRLTASRKGMETQVKDLMSRCEELEQLANSAARKNVERLERRIEEMELQVTGEVRAHQETLRALKRSDLKAKELANQMEERERLHSRLGESVEQLQAKIRQYRKQVEEAEEVAAVNLAKYRRIQSELEESTQRADAAEHALHRTRSERYTRVLRSASLSGLHQALQDAAAVSSHASPSPAPPLVQLSPGGPCGVTSASGSSGCLAAAAAASAGSSTSTTTTTTVIRMSARSPHIV